MFPAIEGDNIFHIKEERSFNDSQWSARDTPPIISSTKNSFEAEKGQQQVPITHHPNSTLGLGLQNNVKLSETT
jgi:hypothetical protein